MTAAPIVLADIPGSRPLLPERLPRLFVYSGADQADVLAEARRGHQSRNGPARLVVIAADESERREKTGAAEVWLSGRGIRPRGVAFRAHPIDGEIGFVFGGGGVDYRGMGADLIRTFPHLAAPICAQAKEWVAHANWIYDPDHTKPVGILDRLLGVTFLSYLHSRFTTALLGLHPQAVLGFSVGELNAVNALDAWVEPFELIRDTVQSTLYRHDLVGEFRAARAGWARLGITAGRWVNHLVGLPAQDIAAKLDPGEPAYLTARCSPQMSLIGGEPAACDRLLAGLNPPFHAQLDYDLSSHAPIVADAEAELLALYHRPMHPLHGVRAYSAGTTQAHVPTPETTSRLIAAQAQSMVDFVSMVERAYADGVRVFIEHGPSRVCIGWIEQILAGKEHLALAVDGDLNHLSSVVADLVAANVWCDPDAYFDRLRPVRFDHAELERLTLVDRIAELDDDTVVSELKIKPSDWYLDRAGRMAAGLLLETGQAHALLHCGELWDPVTAVPPLALDHCDRPAGKQSFTAEQVRDFADGRMSGCFGPKWKRTDPQPIWMLHEVSELNPAGGPWGRGYLNAHAPVSLGDSHFAGHFPDVPGLPGSLLLHGCLQAMSFYLTAVAGPAGQTGRRPEPVPETPATLRFSGQVMPQDTSIAYEVYVVSFCDGAIAALTADVLCTVDGRQILHAAGLAIRLVPGG